MANQENSNKATGPDRSDESIVLNERKGNLSSEVPPEPNPPTAQMSGSASGRVPTGVDSSQSGSVGSEGQADGGDLGSE
jgi:hypothetical protein